MAPKTTAAKPEQKVSTKTPVEPKNLPQLILPVQLTSPVDIGRLIRELAVIDDTLLQLKLRQSGEQASLPKTGQLMDKIIELNKLNLLQEGDREQLMLFLETVKGSAPVMRFSFSADPSVTFLEQLIAWLRREIHPLIIITVGLQPNIGAGCILRTTNHQFDLSLKQAFLSKRNLLHDQLGPRPVEGAKA